MLAPERRRYLLQELSVRETVRVSEVAHTLQVSEMTVRRDIDALDGEGVLRKVHGGATRLRGTQEAEPGFSVNLGRQRQAKLAIGRAARDLLRPGATIAISAGTTTYCLAGLLAGLEGLTVVTNSLTGADVARRSTGGEATVILTGGERTPSEALVGPVATAAIRSLHVDICFLGVHGIHPEGGLSTPNLAEADTNAALAESADRLVVLADHTKFGLRALAPIVPLAAVDTLITDAGIPDGVRSSYADLGVNLLLASGTGEPA
ncbi:MAG TPA: DeoR/GlpR family DNA-binding transcription regulator [Arthrobacter sp.]|nr:DeoR/GlpR family DNA-binding transcription regulator [Arthrobacter sp.]